MFPEGRAVEFLIAAVVALIVVGPKDLPILLRRLGQFMAKVRSMAAEFRASFDEMARQSELDDLRKEVEAMRQGQLADIAAHTTSPEMTQTFNDISQGLADVGVELDRPVHYPAYTPAQTEPVDISPPSAPEPKARTRRAKAAPAKAAPGKAAPGKAATKPTVKTAKAVAAKSPVRKAAAQSAPAAQPASATKPAAKAKPAAKVAKSAAVTKAPAGRRTRKVAAS